MKKILLILLILCCGIYILRAYFITEKSTMIGRYLKAGSHHLIVDEQGLPTTMGNQTNKENIFDELNSGDKIEVTYDVIRETYPGGTSIYTCKLIERGSIEDIPEDTLNTLKEMGWTFD